MTLERPAWRPSGLLVAESANDRRDLGISRLEKEPEVSASREETAEEVGEFIAQHVLEKDAVFFED